MSSPSRECLRWRLLSSSMTNTFCQACSSRLEMSGVYFVFSSSARNSSRLGRVYPYSGTSLRSVDVSMGPPLRRTRPRATKVPSASQSRLAGVEVPRRRSCPAAGAANGLLRCRFNLRGSRRFRSRRCHSSTRCRSFGTSQLPQRLAAVHLQITESRPEFDDGERHRLGVLLSEREDEGSGPLLDVVDRLHAGDEFMEDGELGFHL